MSFPSPSHTTPHKHTYINITIIIIILRRDQHPNKQNTQIFKKTFEATKLFIFRMDFLFQNEQNLLIL